MRYEDWDILLFYGDGEQRKPLREFRPQCNTTSETEESLREGGVIPVMTCFVPSLPHGTEFEVSINHWGGNPSFLSPYSGFQGQPTVLHFKLLVDGVVSCISIASNDENCTWPKSLTNFNISSSDKPLKFPLYHDSVMQPATWDSRNLPGRIRLEISEGFMAPTGGGNLNFIKVASHAIFSFQPAPLYKLEDACIAYPNPFLLANPLPPQGAWPASGMMVPRSTRTRNDSISSTSSVTSGRSRGYSGSNTFSGSSRSTSGYSIMSASAMPLIQKTPGSMPPPPLPMHVPRMVDSSPQRRHVSIPADMPVAWKKE